MNLANFTPLIELAATLNIAFVAVEVAKGYTNILLNKVFNFKEIIDNDFSAIEDNIKFNTNSLAHIEPTTIGSGNTNNFIEKTKRQYENVLKEVTDKKEELLNWANNNCEFKCFSGLSLMMFLYCIFLLFLSAFKYSYSIGVSATLMVIYCCFSYIKNDSNICCNLKWVVCIFILNCAISLSVIHIDAIWSPPILSNLEQSILTLSALIPFLNFIAFYFLIMRKVKTMKNKVQHNKDLLNNKITPIDEQYKQLVALDEIKVAIQPEISQTK